MTSIPADSLLGLCCEEFEFEPNEFEYGPPVPPSVEEVDDVDVLSIPIPEIPPPIDLTIASVIGPMRNITRAEVVHIMKSFFDRTSNQINSIQKSGEKTLMYGRYYFTEIQNSKNSVRWFVEEEVSLLSEFFLMDGEKLSISADSVVDIKSLMNTNAVSKKLFLRTGNAVQRRVAYFIGKANTPARDKFVRFIGQVKEGVHTPDMILDLVRTKRNKRDYVGTLLKMKSLFIDVPGATFLLNSVDLMGKISISYVFSYMARCYRGYRDDKKIVDIVINAMPCPRPSVVVMPLCGTKRPRTVDDDLAKPFKKRRKFRNL